MAEKMFFRMNPASALASPNSGTLFPVPPCPPEFSGGRTRSEELQLSGMFDYERILLDFVQKPDKFTI